MSRRGHDDPVRLPTRWWARVLPIVVGLLVLGVGGVAVLYVVEPGALGPVGVWLDEQLQEPIAHPRPEATHPGLVWRGVEGGERHITATTTGEGPEGGFELSYRGMDREAGEVGGTLRVQTMGARLSAVLILPDGTEARAYNGMFSPDRTFVSGGSWDLPGSPSGPGRFWWASIEREEPTSERPQMNVNTLSVGALERSGLSPRVARLVVEGRLMLGPYLSLEPLLGSPHIPSAERRLIRERAVVR